MSIKKNSAMGLHYKETRTSGTGEDLKTVTPDQLNEAFDKDGTDGDGVTQCQRWLQDKVADRCYHASGDLSRAINDAAYYGIEIKELNDVQKALDEVCQKYFGNHRFLYDDDIIM